MSVPGGQPLIVVLVGAVAILYLFTLGWPLVSGAVAMSDDVQLLFAHLPEPMYFHWWDSPTGFFRPIEIVSAYLVDPETRDVRVSLLLHIPSTLAILAAMAVALRRLTSEWRLAFAIGALWWLVNVGTAIAVWQPDTVSQTWSGAVGAWTAIAAWVGTERVVRGTLRAPFVAAYAALCVAGLLTKEFFVGWAAGCLVLVVVGFVRSDRNSRRRRAAWLALALPPVVAGLAFVALRVTTGSLELGTGEGRYDLAMGANVVLNVVLATAGFLTAGPSHLTDAPDASFLARAAAPLGAVLTVVIVLSWIALDHRVRPYLWSGGIAIVACTYAAVGPALLTHHVSEYYLFGPNIVVAGLVGIAVAYHVDHLQRYRPALRFVALIVAAAWLGVAALGEVSRAQSVAVYWAQVRAIHGQVTSILAEDNEREVTIIFPEQLGPAEGLHGLFRSTPAHLYYVELSSAFLTAYYNRSIDLVVASPGNAPAGARTIDVRLPEVIAW